MTDTMIVLLACLPFGIMISAPLLAENEACIPDQKVATKQRATKQRARDCAYEAAEALTLCNAYLSCVDITIDVSIARNEVQLLIERIEK